MIKVFVLLGLFLLSGSLNGQKNGNGVLPIKVNRTVSFSTTEGSNMSVDISPDGKNVVFDLLGDLYIISLKGGVARQLTHGLAVNSHPIWSPAGDKIAYRSDASGVVKLTIMDTASKFIQSVGEREMGTPIWNATGDMLTSSSRKPTGEYFMYYLAGGKVEVVPGIDKIINFSTHQDFVYYDDRKTIGGRCIMQYDSIPENRKLLFELGVENAKQLYNIKVSPDGHWVSYLLLDNTDYSLIIVDLIEKKKRVLSQWQCKVPDPGNGAQQYGISTDSKKIVIGYGGKLHLIDVPTGKNDTIPFLANVKVDMGKLNDNRFKLDQGLLPVKYTRYAHASPDGKRLVFSALARIYIMDIPNGRPRLLADQADNQFQPAWSPDGQWIAYTTWCDSTFGQVWRANVNGGAPLQITREPGVYHNPSWSHDGKHIVVGKGGAWWEGKPLLGGKNRLGYGKLIMVGVNDGEVKTISDSIPLTGRQSFSGTGDSILYKSFPDKIIGEHYSYLVAQSLAGGTKVIASGQAGWDEFDLRQIIASPDGKFLVYQRQENLHLVPLSGAGQPTIIYDETQQLPVIRFARGGFDPHWEQYGKVLSWSYANKYYQINPGKIVKAALTIANQQSKTGLAVPAVIDVDIVPDKIIDIDLKVPRMVAAGLVALTNVRIVTMQDKKVIEKGTILINGGRLVAVGKKEQLKIPSGARVMDLSGKTIIPGLIDLHDHLDLPAEIFPQQKWNLMVNLAYGITTARDPGGSLDLFGYEELIETGRMTGPRLFNAGRAVRRYYSINNLEDARMIVQNRARMSGVVVKQYTQDTRLKRQWLLLACEEAGLNMTNEVELDVRVFLGQIKDGSSGVEHNPLWGEAYEDMTKLVAASGTYLTPTFQAIHGTSSAKLQFDKHFCTPDEKLTHYFPSEQIEVRCESWKEMKNDSGLQRLPSFLNHSKIDAAIYTQGGKITMGSHGESPGIGAHFEIWALQMGGLTNMEALRTATILAAGALGMQKDLGSIEAGKIADLLILDKNPLDDIHHTIDIRWVMKDGILYDGNTMKVYNP